MKICPLSFKCIPAERYCFYFCFPSYGISGNLAFKMTVQKFIHYIQKFIRLVIALILVFHNVVCFDYGSKGKYNFYISKKFLTFIENLCFAIWKFRVHLKIPIGKKKLKIPVRLKISVRSENPYLKISVHQWASRPEWCKCSGHLQRIAGSTGRKAGEPQRESRRGCRNTRPPKESRRATNKQIFCYIYRYWKIFAKKVKKNLQV